MAVGQTVLIVDPQFPRALWPVGQVTQVISGVDGRIWTVEVRVGEKSYVRPVARLIPLPELKEEEDEPCDSSSGVEFATNSGSAVKNPHSLPK